MINSIEDGIHTIEIYHRNMPYDKTQRIIDDLYKYQNQSNQKILYELKSNKTKTRCYYRVNERYFPDGISVQIEQVRPMGGIRFIVNPSTFKNRSYDPLALYKPKRKSTTIQDVFDQIEAEFNESEYYGVFEHRNWEYDSTYVSLKRIDLTWNLHFDNRTNLTEVIRLFYHADVENFTMDKYNNDDENAHSFTIKKGPIAFTAYDKNYEVKHNKKLGNEYDEKILRIEIKVERDGFKSNFNLDKELQEFSFDELLHHAYKSRKEILYRYLTMLFPGTGQHLPYQKAVAKIKAEANEKYREAMVLLLEKTSRLKNYTRAKEETKKILKIGERNIRYLIDEFNRINVNPITMKKDAKTKCVECLRMVDF